MGGFLTFSFNAVLIGTFIASCVEMTEMVIIVFGVGAIRGWRSTAIGALTGFVVLAAIVIGLGQAIALIPIDIARVVIGALLLTFGLQWFRQGVIGVAAQGFAGGEEEEEVDATAGGGGGGVDWTAFTLSFKGVLLEGLEVAFIVVAFGAGGVGASAGSASGGNSFGSAYSGALLATILIWAIGFAAKSKLEQVPGRSLKFGVGGLLATFGTFWTLEGLGVHWPGGDLSLAWLYLFYLGCSFAFMVSTRAGLLGPPPGAGLPDVGEVGPAGVAPASARSIAEFQAAHGLESDGVVGDRTRAAIRSVRAERGLGRVDEYALGVDPADAGRVRRLQRRFGLPVTGEVDGPTRGALRVLQHPGILDPLDREGVRRFQRDHGIDETGEVDASTRIALAAVLADPGAGAEQDRAAAEQDGAQPDRSSDPLRLWKELDITEETSVCRFQRSLGMGADGVVDAETRGAIHVLRTLADAGSPASLPTTTIDDPAEEQQIRDFQGRHGLRTDGEIGPTTRQALRWEREHHQAMDVADPGSVKHFQRANGLEQDGIVGERTRAALRALRHEIEPDDRQERAQRYGPEDRREDGRVLEPADAHAVRDFQRQHRLRADGVIGPRTQTALRSVRAHRAERRNQASRHTEEARK